jgi:hypothetical protein
MSRYFDCAKPWLPAVEPSFRDRDEPPGERSTEADHRSVTQLSRRVTTNVCLVRHSSLKSSSQQYQGWVIPSLNQ